MPTSYSNIGGSGYRLACIVPSVSGITLNPGPVTNLLDGNTASYSIAWNTAAASGAWLKFDFLYPAIIDEAKWYQTNGYTHGVWKWQGSNDNTNWVDIGSSFTLGGTLQVQTQLNGNTTAYRYYRLLGISGNMSWSANLLEIEFKITYNSTGVTPAYGNALSMGDRTATITLTSDIGKGGGNYTDLINGSYSGTFYFSGGTVSGHYIKFNFGVMKVVDEAKWVQTSGAQTHGVWKWQGSNDNTNWVDIGSSFTLGGTLQVQTQLNGNTTAYRYYRLLGISGNSSGTPFVAEIVFQIGESTVQTISPTCIASEEAFGTPILIVGPSPCRSLTTCEDLPAPPADCRSLTTCTSIGDDPPADCRSLTTCSELGLNSPDAVRSLTTVQSVPLSNGGLFLVF